MKAQLNIKHLAFYLLSGSTIIGCGGGGGGGGGGESPAPAQTSTSEVAVTEAVEVPEPQVSGEAATTRELVVPQGFDLSQDFDISLSADARSFGANQAHLSVCTEFSQDDTGAYEVDYSSCMLKTALNPTLKTVFSVPGAVTSLIATILPLDVSGTPTYRVWQRSGDDDQTWIVQ